MGFNFDLAKKATFILVNALTAIYTSMRIGDALEARTEKKKKRAQKEKEAA